MTRRKTLSAVWLAVAAVCLLLAPVGATSAQEDQRSGHEPRLTVRQFCQIEGGFAVYVALQATGFPRNSEGTFLVSGEFPFPIATDVQGVVETSWGLGLTGLDDPRLGQSKDVTIEVAGVAATETVTLTCDPAANAPSDKGECAVEVFRFFFSSLGFPFANQGDCGAFLATGGRNEPGLRQPGVANGDHELRLSEL